MKKLYCLAVLALLISCKEEKKTDSKKVEDTVQKDSTFIEETSNQNLLDSLVSDLRPGEKLELEKVYTDEAEFVMFDTGGDYSYFVIKKDNKTIGLTSNIQEELNYTRGDIFEVKWKIDSSFVAGDGERLEYTEWFISAKKVKDGSVSLFRKKYTKQLKYTWSGEIEYGTEFKDYLYDVVEYYLANSTQELIKSHIKGNSDLTYSIEERKEKDRNYIVLGIATEFEHRTSIIQWLYIDVEDRKLYEYDLGNDKLVEFP